MIFTICRSLIDSVGSTVFHAAQNAKSRISTTRKIVTTKADMSVFITENKNVSKLLNTLVTYDDIPLGLGGNGALIRPYTQEICLSFSYSKVKWNGELLRTNK